MNLQYLFEIQAGLVEHIEENHPRQEGEDRLAKKILSLQVELGELANELPEVFKFWSNKKNDYEKALKEYVDGLHFILDIGLELDYRNIDLYNMNPSSDVVTEFNLLFANVSGMWLSSTTKHGMKFRIKEDYRKAFSIYLSLGEMLGFTWELIEQAYMEKNKVNHERQVNGY